MMARPKVRTSVEFVNPTPTEVQVSRLLLGKIRETLEDIVETYKRSGGTLTADEERQIRGSILATQSIARMAASDVRILAQSDSTIAHLLKAEGALEFENGFVPAKMARCVEICEQALKPIVVFTEYQNTAIALRDSLKSKGVPTSLFIGGGGAKREVELEDFKTGKTRILVATSAAERGLNLQNAKKVIHYDHKFTPDAFFQRTGRVTRIGSKYKNVDALFMVTRDTVDERVFSVAVARAGLAGATAAKSAEDFGESDYADMLRVLTTHANPVALSNKNQLNHLELTQALVA
jgi:superfamily II DNA/RNA helicase